MGRNVWIQYCHGVSLDRSTAGRVHEALVERLRAAGCPENRIHPNGADESVGADFVFALERWLGPQWEGACMLGFQADSGVQETEWFGVGQYDDEVGDYAVGFQASQKEMNLPPSKELASKWAATFEPVLDDVGVRSVAGWEAVPQTG